ncbi:hypothetical protein TNCV_146021 [Trichonephila clavipes]|nr:hypothetical protein TNCV_146021 [Trichonephila clavipes]
MFADCGVPYEGKWCSGDTFAFPSAHTSHVMRRMEAWGYLCVPFGPRFTVDIWQEVSAAGKGWRFYPLDPRPDALALYSRCTPDTAPTPSNSLSISAASSSSTACPVPETSTTTSNTIPATSQDAKQTSKHRKKKRPPKNPSNTIKPKIEIKMAPHKPRKSAPIEYTMDEEDMIVYDGEDEPELNPDNVKKYGKISYKEELVVTAANRSYFL